MVAFFTCETTLIVEADEASTSKLPALPWALNTSTPLLISVALPPARVTARVALLP